MHRHLSFWKPPSRREERRHATSAAAKEKQASVAAAEQSMVVEGEAPATSGSTHLEDDESEDLVEADVTSAALHADVQVDVEHDGLAQGHDLRPEAYLIGDRRKQEPLVVRDRLAWCPQQLDDPFPQRPASDPPRLSHGSLTSAHHAKAQHEA